MKAKFEQVQSRFEDNQQDIDFLHPRILKSTPSPDQENETEKENQKEEPQSDQKGQSQEVRTEVAEEQVLKESLNQNSQKVIKEEDNEEEVDLEKEYELALQKQNLEEAQESPSEPKDLLYEEGSGEEERGEEGKEDQ